MQKFHEERRSKLGAVLDSERWRPAEVTPDIQASIHRFLAITMANVTSSSSSSSAAAAAAAAAADTTTTTNNSAEDRKDCVVVDGECFVAVGAALFFLPQMFEYCNCVENLPTAAPDLLTRLVELLKTFNSRTCQLVLGAGALPLVGLKTISSRNLALASRSLQLIAFFIPRIKNHFDQKLPAKQKTMVKHFDQALKVILFISSIRIILLSIIIKLYISIRIRTMAII